ncbi:MAG: putative glycoside hydrolase [Patescibacteria group bacterium]|nr:putative glycoside hydrolase [Patescibacteria group bacterium]
MASGSSWLVLIVVLALGSLGWWLSFFVLPDFLPARIYNTDVNASNLETDETSEVLPVPPWPVHVATPEAVKTIYMTQCVAGTPSFRADLVELIEETELNSVVIDIKDYTGGIAFSTEHPALVDYVSDHCGANDMEDFVAMLHNKGIYVIGRITVFQDPLYAAAHPELAVKRASDGGVWKDKKKLSFIDVGARPFWDYIIALAQESYALGFDELNFDYVRFPSDGNMKDIAFPHSGNQGKAVVLEKFFTYLHGELRPDSGVAAPDQVPVLSADLFGMTTTNTDDLNIGQVLERALPYFDYIAPMVYPSHYPAGFNGWSNPNDHVYEVIKLSMDSAVRRTISATTTVLANTHQRIGTSTPPIYRKPVYDPHKIRPWLQDFDYGGNYGPEEVRAQIQATYDSGLNSWMLWAPSNRYTKEALQTN